MKYLSIFVAISLLLSFVACEKSNEFDYETDESESHTKSEAVVGYEDGFGFSEDEISFDFSLDISDLESSSSDPDSNTSDTTDGNDNDSSGVSSPEFSDGDNDDDREDVDNDEDKNCAHINQKTINVKAATCSQNGYSGDKVCSTCGVIVKKGSAVLKTAHPSFETRNKTEPTLKSEGYSGDKICSVCKTVVAAGTTVAKLSYSEVITPSVLQKIEDGFVSLVNAERVSKGLNPLSVNSYLDSCAMIRANEIKTSFSHTRPNGESCFSVIDSSRYTYYVVGENIGYISHVSDEPFYPDEECFTPTDEDITKVYTKMFQAFKESAGHYENIISPDYEDMGIGIVYGESAYDGIPYFYFAHFFGKEW